MPGFRLKLNGLKNISYASFVQDYLPFESCFELEYFYEKEWRAVVVKPILVGSVIIFLAQFPDGEDSMALVYNERDTWSDIEKESTELTGAIGMAIEGYYSNCYSPWSGRPKDDQPDSSLFTGDHLLN